MVHYGSHVETCHHCRKLRLCAELWNIRPRFRLFLCAACLRALATAVDQADRLMAQRGALRERRRAS